MQHRTRPFSLSFLLLGLSGMYCQPGYFWPVPPGWALLTRTTRLGIYFWPVPPAWVLLTCTTRLCMYFSPVPPGWVLLSSATRLGTFNVYLQHGYFWPVPPARVLLTCTTSLGILLTCICTTSLGTFDLSNSRHGYFWPVKNYYGSIRNSMLYLFALIYINILCRNEAIEM